MFWPYALRLVFLRAMLWRTRASSWNIVMICICFLPSQVARKRTFIVTCTCMYIVDFEHFFKAVIHAHVWLWLRIISEVYLLGCSTVLMYRRVRCMNTCTFLIGFKILWLVSSWSYSFMVRTNITIRGGQIWSRVMPYLLIQLFLAHRLDIHFVKLLQWADINSQQTSLFCSKISLLILRQLRPWSPLISILWCHQHC